MLTEGYGVGSRYVDEEQSSNFTRNFKWPRMQADTCFPSPLKFLACNSRGVCNRDTMNTLKSMVRLHKPKCVFPMETKVKVDNKEMLTFHMGFSNWEVVDPVGTDGGMILIWNVDLDMK